MAKRGKRVKKAEAEHAQVEAHVEAQGEVLQETRIEVAEVETQTEAPLGEIAVEVLPDQELLARVMEEQAARNEAVAEAEVEADNKQSNSVVASKFKDKYLAQARAAGIAGKAAKRSNWDWLAQQIAAVCLTDKHKIRMEDFLTLLELNGVDHSRWTNRNKGWEGRLRMTGRVALQKVVANSGVLKVGDGQEITAPPEFIARYKDKA